MPYASHLALYLRERPLLEREAVGLHLASHQQVIFALRLFNHLLRVRCIEALVVEPKRVLTL